MTNNLDYAKRYAGMGWAVFPCNVNKKPLTDHGLKDAVKDEAQLIAWWSQWPNASIGIATGEASGIFVLDVDVKDGQPGEQSLQALQAKYGVLPETPISHTGSGGRHFIFAYPSVKLSNTAKKLGPGLDTRGTGGYIITPPSQHETGRLYEWDRERPLSKTPLALPPDWLISLLTQQAPDQQSAPQMPVDGVYATGSRNQALTSLAGSMRRRGMSEEAIYLALDAENASRCIPPLSDSEVKMIVSSVMRYDPSAAPNTLNKDRISAEWSFAKCLFEYPEYLADFPWMTPQMFADGLLTDFLTYLLAGYSSVQAAADSGTLKELEQYNDYSVPRINDYAAAIRNFARLEQVAWLGAQLQKAAQNSDLEKIDRVILDINKSAAPETKRSIVEISDTADEVERDIAARVANPGEVWGIPYAWDYISKLTGGKQAGALTIFAGEPGLGKSWWNTQDALMTAIYHDTPVYLWCGEMNRRDILRRMYELLGVNGRNMRSGLMTEQDYEKLIEARALIQNSPIYIDDSPLSLVDMHQVLLREKDRHGIKQIILDYAFLINAPGRDEIERTGNVSREVKNILRDLDLSGTLITSVSKAGMDTTSETVAKSNVRGSGQQLHDADNVFIYTKFAPAPNDTVALRFLPAQHERLSTLHIAKGRDLDQSIPGGRLHFSRAIDGPLFSQELQDTKKPISAPRTHVPSQLPYKESE